MGKLIAVATAAIVICAAHAVAANAQSLQGKWKISERSDPTLAGLAYIDAAGRVTWEVLKAGGAPANLRGYIESNPPKVDLVLTNGKGVARVNCSVESTELMRCLGPKNHFLLTRVDVGPANIGPGTPPRPTYSKESIVGIWSIPHPTLAAIVHVDDAYRAALVATRRDGTPSELRETGEVRVQFPRIEFVFTARTNPELYALDQYSCTMQSTTQMDCANKTSTGKVSRRFVMTRISGEK